MQGHAPHRSSKRHAPTFSCSGFSDSSGSDFSSDSDRPSSVKPRAGDASASAAWSLRSQEKDEAGASPGIDARSLHENEFQRNVNGHILCCHGVRLYRCTSCGGAGTCAHDRHKHHCVPCGGDGICEHQRRKYRCHECKRMELPGDGDDTDISRRAAASIMMHMVDGSQALDLPHVDPVPKIAPESCQIIQVRRDKTSHILCQHNVRLYRCIPCGGTGICEHNRRRYYCVPCGGGGICSHNRRRDKCLDCKRERSSAGSYSHSRDRSAPATSLQAQHERPRASRSSPSASELQPPIFHPSSAHSLQPFPTLDTGLPSPLVAFLAQQQPVAASTSIDKSWPQSLAARAPAQHVADVAPPPPDNRKRRGPYAKTIERALLKYESERLMARTAFSKLPVHKSQNFAIEGDVLFNIKGCNCKHSHCLKRYCECHAAGARCTVRCKCLSCSNGNAPFQAAEGLEDEPAATNLCAVPAQPPPAVETKFVVEGDAVVHAKGCNCKHSHCLKRYCECHAAGARCTVRCKCLSCENCDRK